ncbi:Fc.00g053990.m01.CDS01 [Cosmosporella sp. VM-42]
MRYLWLHSGLVDSIVSLKVMIPSRESDFTVRLNSEDTPAFDSIIANSLCDHFCVDHNQRVDLEASWDETSIARIASQELLDSLVPSAHPTPLALSGFRK